MYLWLIIAGSDPAKLVRTHRVRMKEYVNRFVLIVYALTAVSVIVVTVTALHDVHRSQGFDTALKLDLDIIK